MGERDDFQNFLQTGSFRTSRSRSPNPRSYDRSSQASQSYSSDERPSRPADRPRRVYWPPPPSAEDETESLAKEYSPSLVPSWSSWSDVEPEHRGEIDQQPILLPVEEDNPERRFVIVTNSDTGLEELPGTKQTQSPTNPEYDENTCRQFVLVSQDEGSQQHDEDRKAPREPKESDKKPGLAKKRSHKDLPRLETRLEEALQPEEPSIRRSNSRRNREKPIVDQPTRESARPSDDAFLSPVVTHTAGGRERAYLDINGGGGRSPGGSKSSRGERGTSRDDKGSSRDKRGTSRDDRGSSRNDDRKSSRSSASPSIHRRMSSTTGPRPPMSALGASALAAPGYGNPDDVFNFMNPGNDFPRRASESPTKTRKSDSPPYPDLSRDRLPDRPAGSRSRRESNAREQGEYYGSESYKSSRSNRSERPRGPRRATEPDSLLSPDQAWPIPIRSGQKGPSPLPSPRLAQGSQFPENTSLPSARSPRSSTFPASMEWRRDEEYSASVPTAASGSPPRRPEDGEKGSRPRASSRSTSIPDGGPLALPIAVPPGRGSATDRRPPPTVREEPAQNTGSPVQYWQPGPFDPEQYRSYLDNPVTSYRRYSEDVQHGVLPELPECRWITPTIPRGANTVQFLTLPRVDNFMICPDCFGSVFANKEEFRQAFVPVPPRSPDQAISCDFGSSPWYRIAFLMTMKHRYPDLRLLENVAGVAGRNQPCPGAMPANRIWHSMMNPNSGRPIPSFSICSSCAGMIGALFPNLSGAFLPLHYSYAAASKIVCELHFAPDRKRFLDYFDLMETTSDRAHSRRSVPDLQGLADSVREISLNDECPRSLPLQGARWHIMDTLPEFTVCDECYDEVVWPLLEDNSNDVVSHFISKRQTVPVATCQLYSKRMRDVFKRACRRNDMNYLETKVSEKLSIESDLKAKQAALLLRDQKDPGVQQERADILKKLKDVE